jgi:hypothetical protein
LGNLRLFSACRSLCAEPHVSSSGSLVSDN